jgi:nitrite reductase (NADH) small subunit
MQRGELHHRAVVLAQNASGGRALESGKEAAFGEDLTHALHVTLLFPGEGIGARIFTASLARSLNAYYRDRGVDVRAGESATGVERMPGTGKVVQADGKLIALFNLNGTFYALDNRCTHVGGPLGQGRVEGGIVICPWHGSRFDITTGNVVGPPARRPVATYRVTARVSYLT